MSCLGSEWHRRATAVPTNPVPGKETPRRGMEKGRAGIPVASHTAVLSRASCHPPVPPALASGPWEGRRGCLRGARPPGPAGGGKRQTGSVAHFSGGVFLLFTLFIFPTSQTHGRCHAAPGTAESRPCSPLMRGGGGGSVRAARTLTHSHLPAKTPGWEPLKSRPRTQLFRPVSQARREAAGTASGTSNGSLVQPRTELFLCDFKIKHIRKERR